MKMAKANQEDLDMAAKLVGAFESLTRRWNSELPEGMQSQPAATDEDDEIELERFDSDDNEQCGRVLRYLLDVVNQGNLLRVVWGMHVLLDPANRCVDPDDDCIEHHPDAKAGLAAKDPRPLDDWHDEIGPVLWWRFPIEEPPYAGCPHSSDWPGYHTHWTPIIVPDEPLPASGEGQR